MATKTLICPYCKGKGKAPSSRLSCMVCRAQGTITVAAGATPCSACKGAGRQRGHILSCFTCRGKGVIEPEQTTRGAVQLKRRATIQKVKTRRRKTVHRRHAIAIRHPASAAPRTEPRSDTGVIRPSVGAEKPAPHKKQRKKNKKKAKSKASQSLWQKIRNMLT